ncbi:MAG: hypothetical protein ACYDGO_07105 [Smithellaceae bacterium]
MDSIASVSYANADKKPVGYLNNAYGYEVDLTATYKITNNLSYMMGVGYLIRAINNEIISLDIGLDL